MRTVILGAAESGVGAAILAQKKGHEVFVSDMGRIKEKYKALLNGRHLPWEEGRHTPELILNADEVIKSPGIPENAPLVLQLKAKGIPVISEIEFAARHTNAQMICITGSNGKTTTTSLIYHILRKAGLNVGLAEISSFQLDGMFDFRANVAVLLNITPDHLDRYGFCMQNYVDSKMRILRNQTADDTFIYWSGDEHIGRELERHPSPALLCSFADKREEQAVGFPAGDTLCIKAPIPFEMPLAELSLTGKHNLRNAMAAAMAALAAGAPAQAVREGLSDFPGVEHRLEKAGTVNGVHYVNDSKATNVDACYCALDSMQTPVVLIIGGLGKGNDYSQIIPLVREKCRAVVYLGADNAKLHEHFDGLGLPVADTHSMPDCVAACARLAHEGDTVLLSPCCASFDLFRNSSRHW